jgi:hypothetical protein
MPVTRTTMCPAVMNCRPNNVLFSNSRYRQDMGCIDRVVSVSGADGMRGATDMQIRGKRERLSTAGLPIIPKRSAKNDIKERHGRKEGGKEGEMVDSCLKQMGRMYCNSNSTGGRRVSVPARRGSMLSRAVLSGCDRVTGYSTSYEHVGVIDQNRSQRASMRLLRRARVHCR